MTSISGITDPGHRAGENQDSIGWDAARCLALVADGLGGHASGQVASNIVKQTLLNPFNTTNLRTTALRAHEAIIQAAEKDDRLHGMASTVVAAQIVRRVAQIVWLGDSRAYLWRDGALSRLTRDHSLVEELRQVTPLSETQVRAHPQRNEITNVLGAGNPVPATAEIPLRKGDWILLCSDGLHGELRDEEMAALLGAAPSSAEAAQQLIAAALAHGGHDNVSAVIVAYEGPSERAFKLQLSEGAIGWLAVLGGVILAIVLTVVLMWIRHKR
jgi:protein phosphatase